MLSEHFKMRGYEVFTAQDGSEGIKLCEKVKPHLIVLDLKLKEMDGAKAIPELLRASPHARIVVVSVYQNSTIQKKISGLGVYRALEKPISLIELEITLKNALLEQGHGKS